MSNIRYHLKKRLYQLKAYRRKGFGIHSPFVFHLVTNVIEPKLQFYAFSDLRKKRFLLIDFLKHRLKRDKLSAEEKKLTRFEIRNLKSSEKMDRFIFRLMHSKKSKSPLYIGDGIAYTSFYLCAYDSRNTVVRIGDAFRMKEISDIISVSNIRFNKLYHGISSDFVVISGQVSFQHVDDFKQNFTKYLTKDSYVVIKDIHKIPQLNSCWERLKADPFFSVSLDLFYLGILIARDGMSRQHFVRKYRF